MFFKQIENVRKYEKYSSKTKRKNLHIMRDLLMNILIY